MNNIPRLSLLLVFNFALKLMRSDFSPSVSPSSSPSIAPTILYDVYQYCPFYSSSNSKYASINTTSCSFVACQGSEVKISTAGIGTGRFSFFNPVFNRLQNSTNQDIKNAHMICSYQFTLNTQPYTNTAGICSAFYFFAPGPGCQQYTVVQGCMGDYDCTGQTYYSISKPYTPYPNFAPTILPSLPNGSTPTPTLQPSSTPSMKPSNFPTSQPSYDAPTIQPSSSPTSTCLPFKSNNTNFALENTQYCYFHACAGNQISAYSRATTAESHIMIRLIDENGQLFRDPSSTCMFYPNEFSMTCTVVLTLPSTLPTCRVFAVAQGCFGDEYCEGSTEVTIVTYPSIEPTPRPTTLPVTSVKPSVGLTYQNLTADWYSCPPYTVTNTNYTNQNVATCEITVCRGNQVNMALCNTLEVGDQVCTTPAFVRVFESTTNRYLTSLASNCGQCLPLQFTPTINNDECVNYVIKEGCYGNDTCSAQTFIQMDPSIYQPRNNEWFQCPPFTATNTSSARQNTPECNIPACPGDEITITYCTADMNGGNIVAKKVDSGCVDDALFRLYDETTLIASIDDSCGLCPYIRYTVTSVDSNSNCRMFHLKQGCYKSSSCSGKAAVYIDTHPTPSFFPSFMPSKQPSISPTDAPTVLTLTPTLQPSASPTIKPTKKPTVKPSTKPSYQPTMKPSTRPSLQPSVQVTSRPTTQPTPHPSAAPSACPSTQPTYRPSLPPSLQPTSLPTTSPPSIEPSVVPSNILTNQPLPSPTFPPSSQRTTPFSSPAPSSLPTSHPSFFRSVSSSTQQPTSSRTTVPSTLPSSQSTHSSSSSIPTSTPSPSSLSISLKPIVPSITTTSPSSYSSYTPVILSATITFSNFDYNNYSNIAQDAFQQSLLYSIHNLTQINTSWLHDVTILTTTTSSPSPSASSTSTLLFIMSHLRRYSKVSLEVQTSVQFSIEASAEELSAILGTQDESLFLVKLSQQLAHNQGITLIQFMCTMLRSIATEETFRDEITNGKRSIVQLIFDLSLLLSLRVLMVESPTMQPTTSPSDTSTTTISAATTSHSRQDSELTTYVITIVSIIGAVMTVACIVMYSLRKTRFKVYVVNEEIVSPPSEDTSAVEDDPSFTTTARKEHSLKFDAPNPSSSLITSLGFDKAYQVRGHEEVGIQVIIE